ncbi:hypothetical protein [uncultured Chryseobacterium sp.]|uniref:hypothetical protein n=1 Tax=uncultured Chryseobacterium sp. TaxID=259322 RepID=UPI003747B30C
MNLFRETFFEIGKHRTYKYSFIYKNYIIDEYINCIVIEHIRIKGELRQIKVKQIHNVEDYLLNKSFENYTERILQVEPENIQFISDWN